MIVLILAVVSAAFGLPAAGRRPAVRLPGVAYAARFVGLFSGGLFAGFLLAVLVLELALRHVDASVYLRVRHVELVGLDVLAAATLLPALVATAVLVVADRTRGRAFRLTLTALVLLVLAFAITVVLTLPIHTEQWGPTAEAPPASALDPRQLTHAARTGVAVLALGCLSAAALVARSSPAPRTTWREGVHASRGALSRGARPRAPGRARRVRRPPRPGSSG